MFATVDTALRYLKKESAINITILVIHQHGGVRKSQYLQVDALGRFLLGLSLVPQGAVVVVGPSACFHITTYSGTWSVALGTHLRMGRQ